ncbi:hypothetical protein JKF63_02681 [Porcisia hertigi]|uniref:Uncharacterized protein n=1 Tax=Porcisia hertigi TaxID=2761500 RepID=A0A836HP34_9TRYP|nr:hypothetical protein JKF63_02681 [Porcisia hertigi]
MRRGAEERSMAERVPRVASPSPTVEDSTSPFTSLATTSWAESLDVYSDSADEGSIASGSPPFLSRHASDSLLNSPFEVGSPIVLLGDVSESTAVDLEAQPEGQHTQYLLQTHPKPSLFSSALSLRSSFFSYTSDASTSAELLPTSESPASTLFPLRTALPANEEPLKKTESWSPRSQPAAPALLSVASAAEWNPGAREGGASPLSSSLSSFGLPAKTQTVSSQLSTSSLLVPPPFPAASATATQVLPCCTDNEEQQPSCTSTLAALPLPPSRSPSPASDVPPDKMHELMCSGSSSKEPEVADAVSTLLSSTLTEPPLPTSSSFTITPLAPSPLPPPVTAHTEANDCKSLSQLATSLLVDEADSLVDELHAQSRVNTMALSWVPMPLPAGLVTKPRRRVKACKRTSDVAGHSDERADQVDSSPIEKRKRTRKGAKERASGTEAAASVAEGGMPAPAPPPPPPPASPPRRECISKTPTEDADQSPMATMDSSDTHLAAAQGSGAATAQKKKRNAVQLPAKSSTSPLQASCTGAAHISLSPLTAKLSTVPRVEDRALVADDVPLLNLYANSSNLSAIATSITLGAYEPLPAPSVSLRSQGQKLKKMRPRKVGAPPTAATPQDGIEPLAGQFSVEVTGEEAVAVLAVATPPPQSPPSPPAPQGSVRSERLKGGGASRSWPVEGGTSAASSTEATAKRTTSAVSVALSGSKRRRAQRADASTSDFLPSKGNNDTHDYDNAVAPAESTVRRAVDVKPSPLETQRFPTGASASASPSGRPCLWIELAEGFQEAHGSLLRQLCVCWARLHQEGCLRNYGDVRPPIGPPSLSWSSTSNGSRRKRTRRMARGNTGVAGEGSPPEHTNRRANNGLIVLLCPPSLSVEETLRWWTQRAHVEHSYMPPLLAVSMSEDSSPSASRRVEGVPGAPQGLMGPVEHRFFKGVIEQATSMYCIDAARSIAVSCSAAGYAALAQLLSSGQVFESLRVCVDVLGSASDLLPITSLVKAALKDDADVGSLTAVLAITAPGRDTDPSSSPEGGQRSSLVQAEFFAELCQWNGLAAALQQQPRRPQMVLRRVCVDTAFRSSFVSKGGMDLGGAAGSFSASKDAPERALSASSIADSSLPQQPRQQWFTHGMVLPATRNEDTFASSAHREDRVLASQPPPVALVPAHMSAFYLFGRVLFTSDNYATAVNVVDSHSRVSQRHLSDYLSDYSCVTTGPLRYSVSATIRRYLQVRIVVTLSPLLALVNRETATQQLGSSIFSSNGADVSLPSTSALLAPVMLLARLQWRTVVPSLSCTCNPRLYEQVPHTEDGVKVCRHLAELFHYFVTHHFSVVGHPSAQRDQPPPQHQLQTAPVHSEPISYSLGPQVAPCITSLEQRQLSRRSGRRRRSSGAADTLANNSLSSALNTHTPHLSLDAEGSVSQEKKKKVNLESAGSPSSTRPPGRRCSLRHDASGALSFEARRDSPPARPSPKVRRSSAVAAAAGASAPSSTTASAAGTDFHTEALQYALRLVQERLRDSGGGRSVDGGGTSLGAALATEDGESLQHPSGPSPPPRLRKRARSGVCSGEKSEHVQALRLVEKLLCDQLR